MICGLFWVGFCYFVLLCGFGVVLVVGCLLGFVVLFVWIGGFICLDLWVGWVCLGCGWIACGFA